MALCVVFLPDGYFLQATPEHMERLRNQVRA